MHGDASLVRLRAIWVTNHYPISELSSALIVSWSRPLNILSSE